MGFNMHADHEFSHRHHRKHSHAAPMPARITDALLHLHYRIGAPTVTTATLVGTTPTTRTDGSALNLSDITAINVLDDVGDGNGPQQIGSIAAPGATFSFTTGTLAVATHTFTVVVADDSGHVSAPSNAAQLVVAATLAAPSAVADLAVTANAPASSAAPAAAKAS
jgi:hypothetical protein